MVTHTLVFPNGLLMSYPVVQLTLLAVADMINPSFNLTISENVQSYFLLQIGQWPLRRGVQANEMLMLQSYASQEAIC